MKIFIALFLIGFTADVIAQNVRVERRRLKPVTGQAMIEVQSIGAPTAADTTSVISASTGATSAAVRTVTSGLTNPDVPRNLVITPGSTTADVAACNVTVSGTNILGSSISEVFAFLDNASTATTGSKAFKTVTSVSWAASCEDSPYGATWSIGVGEKLGANHCMDDAGQLVFTTFDGAYETTRATVASSATAVESNTFDINGTMNGSKICKAYYIQNFRCF